MRKARHTREATITRGAAPAHGSPGGSGPAGSASGTGGTSPRRDGSGGLFASARAGLPAAAALLAASLLAAAPRPAAAQFPEKIKEAAERAAEGEVERQVEEFVRNAVKCAFDDLDCVRTAEEEGEDVVLTDEDGEVMYDDEGQPVTDPDQLPPEKRPAAADNFDFEPGKRTIFEADFADDRPGDFPRRLAYLGGNMQVVETSGGRFLRAESGRAGMAVPLDETLPERFTVEFEAHDPHLSGGISVLLVRPERARQRFSGPKAPFFAAGRAHGSGIYGRDDRPISVTDHRKLKEEVLPVRIMVDGEHAKMFIGRDRVANVPRVALGRSDSLYFFFHAYPPRQEYPMVGNLRIAAGGRDLYEALEADGRVAVRDILFDTGKADIRPESAEVLEKIAGMLEEHPDLGLMIEGHTDDEGEFDRNMRLSSERAAAVKAWLVERHGVHGGRLRTVGLGPTRPVADNDTGAGRQENRRVELVRIHAGG